MTGITKTSIIVTVTSSIVASVVAGLLLLLITRWVDSPAEEGKNSVPALLFTYKHTSAPFFLIPKDEDSATKTANELSEILSSMGALQITDVYEYSITNETDALLREVEFRIDDSKHTFYRQNSRWRTLQKEEKLKFDIPPSETVTIVSLSAWDAPKTAAIYKEDYFTPQNYIEYIQNKSKLSASEEIESKYFMFKRSYFSFLWILFIPLVSMLASLINEFIKRQKATNTPPPPPTIE